MAASQQKPKTELFAIGDPLAASDHKPIPVVASSFNFGDAQVSPDGRWLALVSDESGKPEVYVRPFPPGDGRTGHRLVSSNGGTVPRWPADGKELFYLAPDSHLMSVVSTFR